MRLSAPPIASFAPLWAYFVDILQARQASFFVWAIEMGGRFRVS